MSMAYSTQQQAIKQMDSSKQAHSDCVNENLSMYNDYNSALEGKVKTSHRIIEKLNSRAKSVEQSTTTMKQSHAALVQGLRAKDQPLNLCAWRMEQREKRPLREHVRDHVEVALEEERFALVGTQKKLSEAIKMTMSMIQLLDGKRDEVRHDIEQKSQALTVDELCLRTNHRGQAIAGGNPSGSGPPSARGGSSRGGSSCGLPSPVSGRGRATAAGELSNTNETNRQQEARRLNNSAQSREEASSELRDDNAKLIAACNNVAMEAGAKTERALQDRISEIQGMRKRIESEARESKKKEEHTKNTISETRSQIASLEEPKALCQTHSSWRKQRACQEQIMDPDEMRLEEQKRQLMRTTEDLRNQRQSEKTILTELQSHMERLREDLKDKTAALNIDLNCLTHAHEMASPFAGDTTVRNRYSSSVNKNNSPRKVSGMH